MQTDKDEQRIINRIAKLLKMADDTSSPNEAMIAAKRARKLMDAHQISKTQIELATCEFAENKINTTTKTRKTWIMNLLCSCATLNDCIAVVSKNALGANYIFRGFKLDTVVAKLTMEYLIEACDRVEAIETPKGSAAKNFFRLGFSSAVRQRVKDLEKERKNQTTSDGKNLIVYKQGLIDKHFGALKTHSLGTPRNPTTAEYLAYKKGIEHGKTISLDPQINHQEKPRLLLSGHS